MFEPNNTDPSFLYLGHNMATFISTQTGTLIPRSHHKGLYRINYLLFNLSMSGGQKGELTLPDLDPVVLSQAGTAVGVMTPLCSWDNGCQRDSSLTGLKCFFQDM